MEDGLSAPQPERVDWRAVALFYLIACAISWPIFWWRDVHPVSWRHAEIPGFIKAWLPALGPAIGAVVARLVFPRTNSYRVTLGGSSWQRSAAFVGVTLAALTAVGIGNDQPHLTGLLTGLVFVVYALGEEAGWRGFLQGALQPLTPLRRYVCIGLLWGAWHFTTFTSGGLSHAVPRLAVLSVVWIFGSWGMGQSMDKTRSLAVAAMLHLLFNFNEALPRGKSVYVLGVSIAVWVFLIATWPPANRVRSNGQK